MGACARGGGRAHRGAIPVARHTGSLGNRARSKRRATRPTAAAAAAPRGSARPRRCAARGRSCSRERAAASSRARGPRRSPVAGRARDRRGRAPPPSPRAAIPSHRPHRDHPRRAEEKRRGGGCARYGEPRFGRRGARRVCAVGGGSHRDRRKNRSRQSPPRPRRQGVCAEGRGRSEEERARVLRAARLEQAVQLLSREGDGVERVRVDDVNDHVAAARVPPPLRSVLRLAADVPALHLHAAFPHQLHVQPNRRARLHLSEAAGWPYGVHRGGATGITVRRRGEKSHTARPPVLAQWQLARAAIDQAGGANRAAAPHPPPMPPHQPGPRRRRKVRVSAWSPPEHQHTHRVALCQHIQECGLARVLEADQHDLELFRVQRIKHPRQ